MNTQNTKSFPGLKKSFESEIKKINALIGVNTPFDLKKLSPETLQELKALFEQFHRKYQELLDMLNVTVNPKGLVHQTTQRNLLTEMEISSAENELDETRLKQINVAAEFNAACEPYNWFFYQAVIAVTIAICIYESFLILPVLTVLGFSFISALCLSILFSLILYFYIDLVPRIIALGRTPVKRRIITAVLFLFTTAFFRYLSGFRASYFESQANPDETADVTMTFDPWSFVCISMFFLNVAIAINFFYPQPSQEDKQAMKEYRRLSNDKKQVDNKVKKIVREIAAINSTTTETRDTNVLTFLQGADLEEYIISSALTGFVSFKRLIMKHTQSSLSLGEIQYPFEFQRFFNLKNQ